MYNLAKIENYQITLKPFARNRIYEIFKNKKLIMIVNYSRDVSMSQIREHVVKDSKGNELFKIKWTNGKYIIKGKQNKKIYQKFVVGIHGGFSCYSDKNKIFDFKRSRGFFAKVHYDVIDSKGQNIGKAVKNVWELTEHWDVILSNIIFTSELLVGITNFDRLMFAKMIVASP